MIGKLSRVPLRSVWKHEAHDFTVWLQDNIEVLNEALGLSLENVEREQSAGSFNVDLVAEDGSNRTVVIENQLEKSDHDHLGKLITYLTAFDAAVAIWIVAEPRPEHVNAISWLNESSGADFYLVKVEAVTIRDSPPAPLLTLIVGPSEEAREVGKTKKILSEKHHLRERFWATLLERAKGKNKLFANISPNTRSYIQASIGKRKLLYIYRIRQNNASVELYIDTGDQLENKALFDSLYANKYEIEKAFAGSLDWHRKEQIRSSHINIIISDGGYQSDEAEWPQIQDKMIETMARFENSFKQHIKNL